jgi:hypothetical protein
VGQTKVKSLRGRRVLRRARRSRRFGIMHLQWVEKQDDPEYESRRLVSKEGEAR